MRTTKINKFIARIKRNLSNITSDLVEHSDILAASGIFLIILVIIRILYRKGVIAYRGSFLENFLGEVHGLAFDVLVFGILIVLINKRLERRRDIKRWREEIDNFKGWNEEEAMFRIVGNIRRLNKKGITNIALSYCFLKGADLDGAYLQEADLEGANLDQASLEEANLQGAYLHGTYLRKASLVEAKLQGANLRRARLQGAKLQRAYLQGAYLSRANLQGAYLSGANLQKASLRGAYLEQAILLGANLRGANLRVASLQGAYLQRANLQEADIIGVINIKIEQLAEVKTLYKAKLDPELQKEVKEKYPHLLEKPKDEEESPEEPDNEGR